MTKYKRKSAVVSAIRWTGDNFLAVISFCPEVERIRDNYLLIPLLKNAFTVKKGDWILYTDMGSDKDGIFSSYDSDKFEDDYEIIEGERNLSVCEENVELHYRIAELEIEKERLKEALQKIIDECPHPKLPYGNAIVEIARRALKGE